MPKMIRKGPQNRHEKVLVTLMSGKPVTPDEIRECFKGTDQENVLYRLATNIWNMRLDGADIKVHKKGRKVEAYQLMNPQDFDSIGRYMHGGTIKISKKKVEVATDPASCNLNVEVATEFEVETEVNVEVENLDTAEVE